MAQEKAPGGSFDFTRGCFVLRLRSAFHVVLLFAGGIG